MPERRATWNDAGGVSERVAATIAPLAAGGRSAATELLARAFRDNPINRAVVDGGGERRLRANRVGLHSSLASCAGRSLMLAASASQIDVKNTQSVSESDRNPRGEFQGVLVALPPGSFPLPTLSLFEELRTWIGQGRRVVRRWAEVYRSLAEVHPHERHWYLSLLGVAPAHQRRGLGRALLEIWLESVDRAPEASYLETDRVQNVAFYRRLGFDVRAEVRVLDIDVWCMWRPPTCPRAAAAARSGT